jgi:uncharacterized delta-60 repeat protein
VGGSIDFLGDELSGAIVKITPGGTLSNGFNKIVTDGDINHIVALPDGKFMASGKFTMVNGTPSGNLVRFLADGTVEQTFNTHAQEEIRTFAVQSTGKIIISGIFTNYMGTGYNELLRLNSDGSVDDTFTKSSAGWATEIHINSNDEILLGKVYSIRKLTANGAIDVSFGVNGEVSGPGVAEFVADGKILAAGRNNATNIATLYRLNADGSVDTAFPPIDVQQQILTISSLSNGTIAIGGIFSQYNGAPANVLLFNSDGTFNRTIAVTDVNSTHTVFGDQSQGIVMSGEFHQVNGETRYYLARLNADYSLDTNFKPEIMRSYAPPGIGVQSDGKLIVGGTFDLIGSGDVRSKVLRFNADGSLDESFVADINAKSSLTCLEVQADDKILVGGLSLIEWEQTGFLRLLPDGQLDGSFDIGEGPQINGTRTRADLIRYHRSKIYLAGGFTHFNSQPYAKFVILDKDGKIVGPENKSLPANSVITDIEIQPDGKIVLAGSFPFEGSQPRLIRLQEDGAIDASFPAISLTNGLIKDVAIDSHGRIVVIGAFAEFNGTPANHMVRLNNDGTVDETFNIGDGIPQSVENSMLCIRILPTDIIAISGSFDLYDNEASPGIVFLNPDGSRIDFPTDFNTISSISTMAFRNNVLYGTGRIVYGNGERVSSAVKILFDLPVAVAPVANDGVHFSSMVYPNPFTDRLYVNLPDGTRNADVKVYSQDGRLLMERNGALENQVVLDVDHLPAGLFFVSVKSRTGVHNLKVVRR